MFHVLIIEDELLIALDIEDILLRLGATSVERVDTEQAAVAAAQAHRPDLITADAILRVGFGPAAVDAIIERHGPIPTIFITATPEACRPGALAHVLRKPVNEAAVTHAFETLRR